MSLREWRRRYEKQLHVAGRERSQLVLIGDSIVEGWCESAAFHKTFAELKPLNLGLGGDQTQHVLWRIEHGVLDGLAPRAAILLIGVNNLGNGFSSDDTLLGIRAVLARVSAKLPATPLLVLRVLPAGERADDDLRQKIAVLNPELSALEQPGKIRIVDVGSVFLEADGRILKTQMGDFLHPTAIGYERLSRAVRPLLDEMLAK
jgi:lysophospholipase L1-like esterase